MPRNHPKKNTSEIFRWLALLPGSACAGLLGLCAVLTLSHFFVVLNIYSETFLINLAADAAGNVALGISAIYSAWYIAPYYKRHTVIVMAVMLFFLSGAFLIVAVWRTDYRALLAVFSMNVGSIPTSIAIFKKEKKASHGWPYKGR